MSFPFLPSKRAYERNPIEPNGRAKWQKTGPHTKQQKQIKAPTGVTMFRVLCPASKSDSVIGKGGEIVARIQRETGAKIRLEEIVSGCDERVILITGSEKDAELGNEHKKEDEDTLVSEGDVNLKESAENIGEAEDSSAPESTKVDGGPPLLVNALLLIFEGIIENEPVNEVDEEESKKLSTVSARLLILSNQVGCLLGKGGSVIKQISADSGAHIRILSKDKLPLCGTQQDEIVQVTGGVDSVKKALHLVGQQLLDNPPRERDPFPPANSFGPSSHPFTSIPRPEGLPLPKFHYPPQGPPFSNRSQGMPDFHQGMGSPFPKFHESGPPIHPQISAEPITFRLLCPAEKVGIVIGKGGNTVKTLQNETGCEVKVTETTPESDNRIIIISGVAFPSDEVAPVQDAVLRVQHRIVMGVPDPKEGTVMCRLIVASNQIGCLLGKGGAVITEIRKLSGAQVRILGKDQIPTGVPENYGMVQISGEFGAVQDALLQITFRLKQHLFRDKLPSMDPNMHPSFVEQIPPYGLHRGRRESSPSMLNSNLPPFQKDFVGHPFEERAAFSHRMHGSGIPPLGVERPGPWLPQGMRDSGGPLPLPDYPGVGPHRRMGLFASGNQSVPIGSVDVVVPRSLVPNLYGVDGGCLRWIREISEAKITITEPRAEATETMIIIAGTPEQTHAAQSLIQAFVLSETSSIESAKP
ncbi:RNA-binding KH domain-containing protein RCF3-like [Zingiber officinale]|uniref:K Homology domain-containing protein n=1 Tax=Zingiber officinale TaxID=94328 RepID=A0A8J5GB01_ZINOF|nr:RNA-binding KH domain-containing protein RCF3-like [Zingiber officinale]XP_042393040.1 RNA-binding KH domain-containing protein RCF3-like [Zingiber officinale]XP_042393041.1 RNA-binding KH domain-containing protein RCF3-like [Zingiber officinale]XP_042393042.1 RNA-binding KH domain-containing protein RCF3-like [Zingiber officinale]XP_042393043.1 RNA-binding KH domain-containing protein RCF3-like [Zingiber officinale]XP_042393044.1 RNA-binding KH domain-containing protein RCF3-like [Zingiber